jgi:hypothetical protein
MGWSGVLRSRSLPYPCSVERVVNVVFLCPRRRCAGRRKNLLLILDSLYPSLPVYPTVVTILMALVLGRLLRLHGCPSEGVQLRLETTRWRPTEEVDDGHGVTLSNTIFTDSPALRRGEASRVE